MILLIGKKLKGVNENLRPHIESLIVDGEDAKQELFHWPFRSIMPNNILIVPQISR